MCSLGLSPSSPASIQRCDGNSDYGSDYDSEFAPPYTTNELIAILHDFYTFLTTLHFSESDLKLPPLGGWPSIPSTCAFKSPRSMEILRHLPYFKKSTPAFAHYNSKFLDYPSHRPSYFAGSSDEYIYLDEPFTTEDGDPVDWRDVICIAEGHESGGRMLFLDVVQGEITEDIVRCDLLGPVDVVEYLKGLKEEWSTLRLIYCTGRLVIEAEKIEDVEGEVDVEVVKKQRGKWGTEVDVRWMRSIYRRYGWPENFRQEEAEREVNKVMAEVGAGERGQGAGWYDWEKDRF